MKRKLDRHEIATILRRIAWLLEFQGENPFKIRAYENGARVLEDLEGDLDTFLESKTLGELKGIGAALEEKITALATTGKVPYYDELRKGYPEAFFELMKIPGLGPKKVKTLHEKLRVKDIESLEKACMDGKVAKIAGFGEKSQEKILGGIARYREYKGRFRSVEAAEIAETVAAELKKGKDIDQLSVGGSLRRGKEIVGDIDLVCASSKPEGIMKRFVSLPQVQSVIAQGDTKSSVLLRDGIQVDLRVVTSEEYPAALVYFTGSKAHNTALRGRAKDFGFKLNEYGLFKGSRRIPCKSEEEIYRHLKLSYIVPELREDVGEIAMAEKGKLPKPLEEGAIRGLFHVHSTYSDGRNSLEEMLDAAAKLKLEYVGISDHSQTASYAGGMKEADIDRQHKELDRLEKKYPKLRIFRGVESDILADGALDYPDRVLKKFDFIIGSVHSHFGMEEDKMTRRCLEALRNPYLTMLGHPTGRLLLVREGFKIDMDAILQEAARQKKIVELNANPYRLDLDWRLHRRAKELGVKVSINPDAHSVGDLTFTRWGVQIARKGGLEEEDVVNTLPLKAMEKFLAAAA